MASSPATRQTTPSPAPSSPEPKCIICCFDGTGNKFGENSNVVRFFSALIKDQPGKQVVYYQPGIGTYSNHQYVTKTASMISTKLDQGIAWYLNDHVKEGYQFIMQHYKKGDKICLFGFSRGAYTARVLMGMLYKVGLLPPDNIQQVDFAFSVYEMTGEEGRELSREFKRTFALSVTVEFVGVWDTVSSVGLVPRNSRHPYTSVNYATKTFRHALALDERRIRFRPQTWHEATTEREQELDVDEPTFPAQDNSIPRYEREYIPPSRDIADVKEVWFAGCHADIGGGSHHNRLRNSLSYIPLRWMIKEVKASNCGILFDENRLKDFSYDIDYRPIQQSNGDAVNQNQAPSLPNGTGVSHHPSSNGAAISTPNQSYAPNLQEAADIIARIYDQLVVAKFWWFLEVYPLITTYQNEKGDWIRKKVRNLGDGRHIPFHEGTVLVDDSVRRRMEHSHEYRPQAINWQALVDTGMIKYVQ